MNREMIIRAWKDPDYRASLNAEERAALPESPSGKPLTELGDSELEGVSGGVRGGPNTLPPACLNTHPPGCRQPITLPLCPTETLNPNAG